MRAQRGFVVVHNPKAGRGRTREVLRLVTSRLDGHIAPVVETSIDASFAPALREWIRHVRVDSGAPPVVVAVGGDGTLGLILNALDAPETVSIAVVPCGSGNDFADAIGCADVRTALDVLEAGQPRSIDFGVVNGRRFANCVGIGLDAEVGALSAKLRARGYPPGPSYYAAALIGLFMVKPLGMAIEADGSARRFDDGVMLTIGNGPSYGGGFRGAPDAKLDDGLLDVYAFSNINGIGRRLGLMQRIRAGTHVGDPNVVTLRCASLKVELARDVAMHVDGETSRVKSAAVSIVPKGLRMMMAPRGSAAG